MPTGIQGFQKGNILGKRANHKGQVAWNKGKSTGPLSKETKLKLRETHKRLGTKPPSMEGKHHSEETKRKISRSNMGKTISQETRKTLSVSLKGRSAWNKGKRMPEYAGKNSPSWKGGLTPLWKILRTSFQYRQWRCDVFERDNYTCQKCGTKGCYLEAHHKKSFIKILRENNVKTVNDAMECAELWNINNGQTLCKKCHREKGVHKNG